MVRIVRTFLAITAAGILPAQAAPDWYSLGLGDRAAVTGKPGAGGIGFDLRGRSVVHASAGELLIDNDSRSGH